MPKNKMDQMSLFPNRIAVDKNFGAQTTLKKGGQVEWKIDLAKNFELPSDYINEILIFLMKQIYDDPLKVNEIEFTARDLAEFHQKNISNYNKIRNRKSEGSYKFEKIADALTDEEYTNNLEITLFKLHKNTLRGTYFEKVGDKYQASKAFLVLESFQRFNRGRAKVYRVKLNPKIIINMCTFLYYTSLDDYRLLNKKFYRNPQWKLLYDRMCSMINTLQHRQDLQISFNELAHILNLDTTNVRRTKQHITEAIKKLIQFPALQGLEFEWRPNDNNNLYVPHFFLNDSVLSNDMSESEEHKFRRVDILVMSYLLLNDHDPTTEPVETSIALGYLINSYQAILKRPPKPMEIESFFRDFMYKGKYPSALREYQINKDQLNIEYQEQTQIPA